MKILFVVDEAYPLHKKGGLGDVAGSLPKEIFKSGIDIRLALPFHPDIKEKAKSWRIIDKFDITYINQDLPIRVFSGFLPDTNIPVYLFEENTYISTDSKESDNHANKFTVFSLAVSHWLNLPERSWTPHLLHLQDWHTGMIPVILRHLYPDSNFKSIITIHNLAYQGDTNTPVLRNLNLPVNSCKILTWDSIDNHINILLEGILHADFTSTVSPTYAKEILTHQYGEKLEEVLKTQKSRLLGILNGIDQDKFNPQTDPHIKAHYNSSNFEAGKAENKKALKSELKLKPGDSTLIGFIGRLDPKQKGISLIIEALNKNLILTGNTQFVFLGTGDENYEAKLLSLSDNNLNCHIATRFDEPLARQIYAAADFLIIPSKYEPCGLIQMIAMRYGTLPIARNTGGLADTITHQKDGFLFDDYSTKALIEAINHAKVFTKNPETKNQMIKSAMAHDFSWTHSAKEYKDLYQQIILEETSS